jgi:hypothetical protein
MVPRFFSPNLSAEIAEVRAPVDVQEMPRTKLPR